MFIPRFLSLFFCVLLSCLYFIQHVFSVSQCFPPSVAPVPFQLMLVVSPQVFVVRFISVTLWSSCVSGRGELYESLHHLKPS